MRLILISAFTTLLFLSCGQKDEVVQLDKEQRFELYFIKSYDGGYEGFIQEILKEEDIPFIQAVLMNSMEKYWKRRRAIKILLLSNSSDNLDFCIDFAKNGSAEDRNLFFNFLSVDHRSWGRLIPQKKQELRDLFYFHITKENPYEHYDCRYGDLLLLFRDKEVMKALESIAKERHVLSSKMDIEFTLNKIRYQEYLDQHPSLSDSEREKVLFNVNYVDINRLVESTYALSIPPLRYDPEILKEIMYHDKNIETRTKAGLLLIEKEPEYFFGDVVDYLCKTNDTFFIEKFFQKLYFYKNGSITPPEGYWRFPESIPQDQWGKIQEFYIKWARDRMVSDELTPEEVDLLSLFWNEDLKDIIKNNKHRVSDPDLVRKMEDLIKEDHD